MIINIVSIQMAHMARLQNIFKLRYRYICFTMTVQMHAVADSKRRVPVQMWFCVQPVTRSKLLCCACCESRATASAYQLCSATGRRAEAPRTDPCCCPRKPSSTYHQRQLCLGGWRHSASAPHQPGNTSWPPADRNWGSWCR